MKRCIAITTCWMIFLLLSGMFFTGNAAAVDKIAVDDYSLIAHRGVVADDIPENSLASLEETIRRGYTHIEVDLRCTRDGHAVCLHDDSLQRTTGLPHLVSELTLAELRALVPVEDVPDFATFCRLCEGRIGLMPDIKAWPPDMEEAFARSIEAPMVEHGLMADAYFIGRHILTRHFSEQGRIAWRNSYDALSRHDDIGDRPGDRYFAFGHAADFDGDAVAGFQALGVRVIVSINIFHYLRIGHWRANGKRDVARMLDYGVDGLQIDSVYESAFREWIAQNRKAMKEASPNNRQE